jgi:Spy/CpxP family protein refolding chaperone
MGVGRTAVRTLLLAGCLLAIQGLPGLAQRPGGGGPPPGGGVPGGGGMPAGSNVPGGTPGGVGTADTRQGFPPNSSSQQGPQAGPAGSTMRGGLQLGPPGRWWDDKHFAKTLHLRPGQKKRMDDLFDENRSTLVSRYQALQQEESKMEVLSRAQTLEESALFAQIDRVAQARAELEKANTHLLLQVRKEMDSDQISHLDASR